MKTFPVNFCDKIHRVQYSFGNIQNIRQTELSEEKNAVFQWRKILQIGRQAGRQVGKQVGRQVQMLTQIYVLDNLTANCLLFFKALFLVLHFPYYTLIAFLNMLYVLLLSMLMVLLSTLMKIKHLICGNNQNFLLNLNLIVKTLQTRAGSCLLISVLEKLSSSCLTSLITLVLLI